MKTVLIGVSTLLDRERESYWMLPGYFEGLRQVGALPVMLPLAAEKAEAAALLERIDGLLLAGGPDLSPALYGCVPTDRCGEAQKERDRSETLLLSAALEIDLPVLGICRGHQLMNAALGGTLYQDLPTELEAGREAPVFHSCAALQEAREADSALPDTERTQGWDGTGSIARHWAAVEEGSPLHRWTGRTRLLVNSYHHQGIKTLASALRPMATAPDGLIEAAYLPGKTFAASVQWHPELAFSEDEPSRAIFAAFVRACEERKEKGR